MAKSPEWTAGRLKSFIISVLRSGTRKYPPKYQTLNEAKTEKRINTKTGRLAQHYLCATCAEEFPATGVQVDHSIPVVDPINGFTTWDEYIERLFCPKENLQVLCLACHSLKTSEEKSSKSTTHKKQKKAPSHSKESLTKKK